MGSEDVVVELVMSGVVGQPTIADVVLDTSRQLEHGRAGLAKVGLQMDFVAEVAIAIACHTGVVDVVEDGRVGHTRKERATTSQRHLMRQVGIDIILSQREVAPVGVQPN